MDWLVRFCEQAVWSVVFCTCGKGDYKEQTLQQLRIQTRPFCRHCFAVLYEAVCYACKWKDVSLVLAAQDIQAAYDGVEQCHAFQELLEGGATAWQILAFARDYSNAEVTIEVPGIAKTSPISFTKGFRTGGTYEPHAFVYMLEAVVDMLVSEWELIGLGFELKRNRGKHHELNLGGQHLPARSRCCTIHFCGADSVYGPQRTLWLEAQAFGLRNSGNRSSYRRTCRC